MRLKKRALTRFFIVLWAYDFIVLLCSHSIKSVKKFEAASGFWLHIILVKLRECGKLAL